MSSAVFTLPVEAHAAPDPVATPTVRVRKILVLDGYSTRTLACVRSWGMNKVPFAVGGESRWDMSLFSRYASERFVYTSPKQHVARFIQDINRYAAQFGADCVFPTSEAGILACDEYRDHLACRPLIPTHREIELSFSKANTLALAKAIGIDVPATLHVTADNVRSTNIVTLRYPVALKSARSETLWGNRTASSKKTVYVTSPEQLQAECNLRLSQGESVLVQEFIEGYGLGLSGLFDQGRPIAVLTHRRVRESNPCGGPSAVAETVANDARLLQWSTALLQKIGFTGPAMVEFKIDHRSGRAYLMEVNGRFWGTTLLAGQAGLDLPYLYWKMLNGIEISPEETRYRVGIRGRYLVGDTKWLLLSLKGKPKHWPGQMTPRTEALKSYLASFLDKNNTELIAGGNDPLPFLARLVQPNS